MAENDIPRVYNEALPEIAFNQLLHNVGAPALRRYFEDARMEANRGACGIRVQDEERGWQLDIDPDHEVSFDYFDWGPFTLPFDYADEIVERAIAAQQDCTPEQTRLKANTPEHISQVLVKYLTSLDDQLSGEIDGVEGSDPGMIGKPEAHAKRLAEAASIAAKRALLHELIKDAPRELEKRLNRVERDYPLTSRNR